MDQTKLLGIEEKGLTKKHEKSITRIECFNMARSTHSTILHRSGFPYLNNDIF